VGPQQAHPGVLGVFCMAVAPAVGEGAEGPVALVVV
jgi:hypothetical protein